MPENHFYLDMPPTHFTMQSSWFYICKFDLPNPPLEIVETRNLHGQTQYLRLLFTFFEEWNGILFQKIGLTACEKIMFYWLRFLLEICGWTTRISNDILLPKLFWPTLRKIVLVIEKIFWNWRMNTENLHKIWDY